MKNFPTIPVYHFFLLCTHSWTDGCIFIISKHMFTNNINDQQQLNNINKKQLPCSNNGCNNKWVGSKDVHK